MSGTYNHIVIVGRLGADPEIHHTTDGQAWISLSVATDHSFKNDRGEKTEVTEWHVIKLFGKTAETAGEYLRKGSLALFEGRIRTNRWNDPQTGEERSRKEITAYRLVLLGSKPSSSADPAIATANHAQSDHPRDANDDDTPPF